MRTGMVTAAPPPMEGAARPMTAVKAAGYSSAVGKFDPFAGAMPPSGPAAPLQKRSEASAEDRCKELERQVRHQQLHTGEQRVASHSLAEAVCPGYCTRTNPREPAECARSTPSQWQEDFAACSPLRRGGGEPTGLAGESTDGGGVPVAGEGRRGTGAGARQRRRQEGAHAVQGARASGTGGTDQPGPHLRGASARMRVAWLVEEPAQSANKATRVDSTVNHCPRFYETSFTSSGEGGSTDCWDDGGRCASTLRTCTSRTSSTQRHSTRTRPW